MIGDIITKMYEDPDNAPNGIELGEIETTGERLVIGPNGTETEFAMTAGHVGIVLQPGDHKIARQLAAALIAWAGFAEAEIAQMRERIAGRKA
jgi:hypothetical protein